MELIWEVQRIHQKKEIRILTSLHENGEQGFWGLEKDQLKRANCLASGKKVVRSRGKPAPIERGKTSTVKHWTAIEWPSNISIWGDNPKVTDDYLYRQLKRHLTPMIWEEKVPNHLTIKRPEIPIHKGSHFEIKQYCNSVIMIIK